MKFGVQLLLILSISACNTNPQSRYLGGSEGKHSHDALSSLTLEDRGITKVGVSRESCHEDCPVYSYTIYSDGRVLYEGLSHVEKVGVHTGSLNKEYHDVLFSYINNSNMFSFGSDAGIHNTSGAQLTRTTIKEPGRKKVILNTDTHAPATLKAIQTLIDHSVDFVSWEDEYF